MTFVFLLLSLSSVIANEYSNCAIYGNCKPSQMASTSTSTSVIYYPNATSISGGTITSTKINDTYWYDDTTYNISEGSGANPLTLYINYTGVTTFSQLMFREYYLGSSSHNIKFQLWNFLTSSWEDYYSITGQAGQTWVTIPVLDSSNHISGGNVSVRLYHVENGISSHRLYIDVAWLVSGSNLGASTNLEGYAKYDYGNNNFFGGGNFSGENISANNVRALKMFTNSSLNIRAPVSGEYYLTISASPESFTGNRDLKFIMPITPITINMTGSPTLANWFNQDVRTTASPTFVTATVTTLQGSYVKASTGLGVKDSLSSNYMYIAHSTNMLTTDKTLTINLGNDNRQLDILGTVNTINGSYTPTSSPTFKSLTLTETLTVDNITASDKIGINRQGLSGSRMSVNMSKNDVYGLYLASGQDNVRNDTTYGVYVNKDFNLGPGNINSSYGMYNELHATSTGTDYTNVTNVNPSITVLSNNWDNDASFRRNATTSGYLYIDPFYNGINDGGKYDYGDAGYLNVYTRSVRNNIYVNPTFFNTSVTGGGIYYYTYGTMNSMYIRPVKGSAGNMQLASYGDFHDIYGNQVYSSTGSAIYIQNVNNFTLSYGLRILNITGSSLANSFAIRDSSGTTWWMESNESGNIAFGTGRNAKVFWNSSNISLQITNNLRVDGNIYYDGALISYSPTIFCSADEDKCMAIDYETKSQVWCSKSTAKCDVNYVSLTYEKLTNQIQCTLSNGNDCLETTSKQRIEDKLLKMKQKEELNQNFKGYQSFCWNKDLVPMSYEEWVLQVASGNKQIGCPGIKEVSSPSNEDIK